VPSAAQYFTERLYARGIGSPRSAVRLTRPSSFNPGCWSLAAHGRVCRPGRRRGACEEAEVVSVWRPGSQACTFAVPPIKVFVPCEFVQLGAARHRRAVELPVPCCGSRATASTSGSNAGRWSTGKALPAAASSPWIDGCGFLRFSADSGSPTSRTLAAGFRPTPALIFSRHRRPHAVAQGRSHSVICSRGSRVVGS
jgi:hypothetical protein